MNWQGERKDQKPVGRSFTWFLIVDLSFLLYCYSMPIFEYRCRKCGHEFERIIFGTPDKIDCPHCESREIQKLLSSFAVSSSGRKAAESSSACGPGRFT